MTTFERLAKRIEKDTGLKLVGFRRTGAGYWQKAQGSWVWAAYNSENLAHDVGSCYTATELLKSKEPLVLLKIGGPYSDEIGI